MKINSALNNFQLGFSIVEILLILMIVGFILSLVNVLPSSLGLVGSSKFESIAKEVAQKQIEDLRSMGFDNLANTSTPPPPISDPRLSKIPGGQGSYEIQDCTVPVCNGETIKTVKVNISWTESGNKHKSIEVNTLIAKGGLQ